MLIRMGIWNTMRIHEAFTNMFAIVILERINILCMIINKTDFNDTNFTNLIFKTLNKIPYSRLTASSKRRKPS